MSVITSNKSSIGEHFLNVFRAGLSTAPFTGGIASLMTDYIPSGKQKRLEELAKKTAEDLEALQDKIDTDRIKSDEYAHIFETSLRYASMEYRKEKLDAYRAILVNSLHKTTTLDTEKEYFLDMVNKLSVIHILLLNFLSDPKKYCHENNIPESKIQGGYNLFMAVIFPKTYLDTIKLAFGELFSMGLINVDKNAFGTMTSSQGFGLLNHVMSDLGTRFVKFISSSRG